MSRGWWIAVSVTSVLAVLVAWEAAGLDGNLSLLPSDMLQATRVFCVERAVWLGSCVYDVAHWIYENIWWVYRRFFRAFENLFVESFAFLDVPIAFVWTAFGHAYNWFYGVSPLLRWCIPSPWMSIFLFSVGIASVVVGARRRSRDVRRKQQPDRPALIDLPETRRGGRLPQNARVRPSAQTGA
jgi:hypothetical protein